MAWFLVERFVAAGTSLTLRDVISTSEALAAAMTARGTPVACLSTLLVAHDEMCLCLFEAHSLEDVREAHMRAGVRFDRITEAAGVMAAAREESSCD